MGIITILAGLFIILVSADIIHADPESIHAPRWVQYFIGLGIFVSFAASFLWIGFGPGERQFSSSISLPFIHISGKGNDIIGRIVFGGSGFLGGLLTAYYALTEARKIISETTEQNSSWD